MPGSRSGSPSSPGARRKSTGRSSCAGRPRLRTRPRPISATSASTRSPRSGSTSWSGPGRASSTGASGWLGLGALVIADVAFTLQGVGGLPEGTWTEPIYLIGALCIGAEAWQPEAQPIRKDARFDGWRELMVPGFFAIVMLGLFAIQFSNTNSALTTILTAATMFAVIARLALSVRDNKRLLEAMQIDQLTGLGNRSGLQLDLERCCARGNESTATLQLLDLNGFKRYNDTFGHPAGDEMLKELGARLRDRIGPDCTAYRVGGDEFAVLVEGSEGRRQAVTKLAMEALRASGSGFEVSAASGTATIPAEADSPGAAMQLADVRMYAQKEARRARESGLERIEADLDVSLEGAGRREAVEQGE